MLDREDDHMHDGGYLIQCLTKIFINDKWFVDYTFTEMIVCVRLAVKKEYLTIKKHANI